MRIVKLGAGLIGALLICVSVCSYAVSPLVGPGNYEFRHSITLLRDAGLIRGPLNMWPVSLPQLNAALADIDPTEIESPAVREALLRVQHRLARARGGGLNTRFSIRVGQNTPFVRSFGDTPRGELEVSVGATWTGDRFAGELHLRYINDDPKDADEWRLDGSWLGVRLGDWLLAAGAIQRYWGPAWQGSLIISNTARPRPGITLRRMRAEPFDADWLKWIGPWTFTTFVEWLGDNRAVAGTMLWGMRVAFSPFQSLQIGISRSALFGGEGHEVDLGSIVNLLTGQSTSTGQAVQTGEDGIDQWAGLDVRWKLPYVNAAIYGAMIGVDESGSRPNLFMGQAGIEFWGGLGDNGGSWRLIIERADTKADVLDTSEREGDAELGLAYSGHGGTGYRYRNRVMGYPAGGDALVTSVRLLLSFAGGSFVNVAYLDGDLNRGANPKNTITPRNATFKQLSVSWSNQYRFGRIEVGIGGVRRQPDPTDTTLTEGYAWIGFSRVF